MADQTLLVVSPASTGSEIDAIEPSLLQMLPCDILEKIETLKIELQDGDITTKGFVKKRGRLLEPFILIQQQETIANLFFNENGGKLKRAISKSNGNVAGEDQHLQVPPSPSVSANNIAAGTTSGGGGGGGGGGSRRGSNNRKSHLFMSNYDSFIQGSNSSLSTSPPRSDLPVLPATQNAKDIGGYYGDILDSPEKESPRQQQQLSSENIEPLKHSFSHSTSHLPLILKTSADNNNDEQPQPLHLISPEISAELGSGGALDSYIGGNSLLHSRHGSIVSVSYSENNPTPNISRRNSSSSHVEDMHTDHIDQIIADEQNSFDHTNPELSLKRRNQKQQLMEMSMLVSNIEPGSVSELMDKNSNTFKQPQPLQRLSTISVSTPSLATAVSTPASRLNNQRIGALKQEGFMRIRTDSNPTTSTPTSSLMKTGTPASGLMVFGNTVIPKFKSDSNLRESMLAVSGGLQASDYSELIGKQAMPTPFVQGELMSAVDEGTNINLNSLLSISAILKLRAQLTEKNVAFTMLDSKGKVHSSMTFGKLHSKAAKVAQNLRQKALLQPGTPVGLVYRRTELLDFVVAVFGCFYAGVAAVPIVPTSGSVADELREINTIIDHCGIKLALTTDSTFKALGKDYSAVMTGGLKSMPTIDWWKTNDFGSYAPPRKGPSEEFVQVQPTDIAYIEYSRNAVGDLKGVVIEHRTLLSQCFLAKTAVNFKSTDIVLSTLETRQQFGFLIGTLFSVFNGSAFNFFVDHPLPEPCTTFFRTIAQNKDYTFLLDVRSSISSALENLKKGTVPDLSSVENIFIDTVTPNAIFHRDIMTDLFPFGLGSSRSSNPQVVTGQLIKPVLALNELAGCVLSWKDTNFNIENSKSTSSSSSTAASPHSLLRLILDNIELQSNHITIKGHSGQINTSEVNYMLESEQVDLENQQIRITESGFIAVGLSVAIVNPDTLSLCANDQVGEIWIQSNCSSLPNSFHLLPQDSTKIFKAVPTILSVKTRAPSSGIPSNNVLKDVLSTPLERHGSFIRTGIYGFLVDNWVLYPESTAAATSNSTTPPRLFTLGMRHERVRQRNIMSKKMEGSSNVKEIITPVHQEFGTPEPLLHSPTTLVKRLAEFDVYYTNFVIQTLYSSFHGIDACALFSAYVNGEHLPVLLIETSRSRDELLELSRQIYEGIRRFYRMRIFAIGYLPPNKLPRMSIDQSRSSLGSTFVGYHPAIISKYTRPSNQQYKPGKLQTSVSSLVVRSKWPPVDLWACKSMFSKGVFSYTYMWMNPSAEVLTNIPHHTPLNSSHDAGKNVATGAKTQFVFSAGADQPPQRVGQIWGSSSAIPIIDDFMNTTYDLTEFPTICHLLIWRSVLFPDLKAVVCLDHKGKESDSLTYRKLSSRIANLALHLVQKKQIRPGDYVIVLQSHGIDFIVSLYACMYAGIIPIPVSPPDSGRLFEDLNILTEIVMEFHVKSIILNQTSEETLKSKSAQAMLLKSSKKGVSPALASSTGSNTNSIASGDVLLSCELINIGKVSKQKISMSSDDPMFQGWSRNLSSEKRHPTAFVQVYISPDMKKTCVHLSHRTLLEQCRVQAIHCEMLPSTIPEKQLMTRSKPTHRTRCPIVTCVRSYNGLGFVHSVLLGIYVGSLSVIVPPFEYFIRPLVWYETIHNYEAKDAHTTYPMLEHAMNSLQSIDYRAFSLHNLKSFLISTEGRTHPEVFNRILKCFSANRLDEHSVSATYSPIINPMVSSRSHMSIGTTTLWLDSKELVKRKLKVLKENTSSTLYKNEKPELVKPTHCMIVQDSGAVLNNNIVAIVNPETGQLCDPDEYGEIWVCSPANIDSYSNSLQKDNESNFNLSIEGVDSNVRFTRTGDYGFLWPVRESDHDEDDDNNSEKGSLHNSNNRLSPNNNACGWDQLVFAGLNYQMVLFVLGSVNETIEVNGMLHYPSDIEDTIDASHINIVSDSCVVFTDKDSVVAAVEIEKEAFLMNTIPSIVTAVLEHHQFIVTTILFVAADRLPKSRLYEKQRDVVRNAFKSNKLELLYLFDIDHCAFAL